MNHASLFSGIGGFDLAAEWCGWNNVFHCEIDPFCQKILQYHFPSSEQYTDITQSDFSKYANTIDILTGGFPCQPFSVAGKREGSKDSRFLWKEMFRVIQSIKPTWIVAENVHGIVSIEKGMVFESVQTDLENEGFEVQPVIIPACSVNAPHKRNRIWFIAYSDNNRRCNKFRQISEENGKISKWNKNSKFSDTDSKYAPNTTSERFYQRMSRKQQKNNTKKTSKPDNRVKRFSNNEHVTNTKNARFSTCFQGSSKEQFRRTNKRNKLSNHWENFPTISPICGGNDGIPSKLDGITFSKWRKESIKAYGNAIVPQVAYNIFQTINQVELFTNECEGMCGV